MSISHLTNVLAPPPHALATGRADEWEAIASQIGAVLPKDYKDFIAVYGQGCIDGFLWVYSPFTTNAYLNLLSQSKVIFNSLRLLHEEFKVLLPFPVFPETDGVFPWGCSDNGDYMYWRFRNGRLQQPLVVAESRGPRWQEFDMSMTDFLAEVLAGRVKVSVFPGDFPTAKPSFVAKE